MKSVESVESVWFWVKGSGRALGLQLARGPTTETRVGDIWDLGVCDPGGGYGICLWFVKISIKCNPCFVVPVRPGTRSSTRPGSDD